MHPQHTRPPLHLFPSTISVANRCDSFVSVCVSCVCLCPGAITTRAGRFGEGFGRVHLDNLNCSGSEERLYDCQHSSFTEVTCYSFESDVGVVCGGMS